PSTCRRSTRSWKAATRRRRWAGAPAARPRSAPRPSPSAAPPKCRSGACAATPARFGSALLAGWGSPLGECPPAFGLLLDFAQRATPPGSAYLKRVAHARLQEAAGFECREAKRRKRVPLTDDSKRSGGGQGHRLSRGSAH